jgi:hypothetical protein
MSKTSQLVFPTTCLPFAPILVAPFPSTRLRVFDRADFELHQKENRKSPRRYLTEETRGKRGDSFGQDYRIYGIGRRALESGYGKMIGLISPLTHFP